MLNRFITENLIERGKEEVLCQSILLVDKIKKKPEILEILDPKSEYYLEACINQPVSGFIEIAALMEIAEQDNITEKIEKAKIIRTQELIKDSILSLKNEQGQNIGRSFEVELANAMISKVHEKLLAKNVIKTSWPGIPSNIVFEGAVLPFLKDENINKTFEKTKEVLAKLAKEESNEEIIDYLCNVKQVLWAKLILTKEDQDEIDRCREENQRKIEELRNEIISIEDLSQSSLEQIKNKNGEIEKLESSNSIILEKKLKEKTKDLLSEAKSGQGGHGASSSSQPTSQPSSPLGEERLGGGSLGKKRKERQD